jgi:triosephosphate isomerase
VNEINAAAYAVLADVDGFVVGRAGLDPIKLKSIIQTLASLYNG